MDKGQASTLTVREGVREEMAAFCTSLSALSFALPSPRISCAAQGSEFESQVGVVSFVRASHSGASGRRQRWECPGNGAVRWQSRGDGRLSWPCGARRKESSATKTEVEVLDDEDLRAGLNEVIRLPILAFRGDSFS